MDDYERALDRIRELFPHESAKTGELSADSVLVDMGIDSIRLLMLLSSLRKDYPVDMKRVVDNGLPTTIGDLCALLNVAPRALD
jgi:aryl carrier-like protein